MKKTVKLLALAIVIALVIVFCVFAFGSYTTHNISNYLNDKYYSDYYAEKFMPEKSEFENAERVDFTYHRDNHFFEGDFSQTSNSYVLNVEYSKTDYDKAVERLKNKCTLFSDCVTENGVDIYRCHSDSFDYPRVFGMVGLNEKDNRVIYMFFVDEGNVQDDENAIINKYFEKFI